MTAIIALFSVVGGVVLGFVAIVLGFLGRGRVKRGEATNGGVAIAGIVLGFLSIVVSVAFIGIVFWGFNQVGGTGLVDCMSKAGNDPDAQQACQEQFQSTLESRFSITTSPSP